jgi:hypothetical protein
MTYVKPISGHTGLAGARRYFERDGRALAHDYLELDAPVIGEDEDGLPAYEDYAWDEAMDDRRDAEGNDSPWRGRRARTYKHYVLSPDPADAITLAQLRVMATSWARDSFPDFQVAIVYHDDNENHVLHAHVIVNNTNVRTGRRLQDPDPGALNGRLQAISREMGLSHFEGRLDPDHHDTRETGARTDYQRVHVGREESEIAGRDGYSWVADIRARVDIARGTARDADDLRGILSTMGVTVEDTRNGDWKFALSDQPSRCVTGTRLGTDYQRPNVTRELVEPSQDEAPRGLPGAHRGDCPRRHGGTGPGRAPSPRRGRGHGPGEPCDIPRPARCRSGKGQGKERRRGHTQDRAGARLREQERHPPRA